MVSWFFNLYYFAVKIFLAVGDAVISKNAVSTKKSRAVRDTATTEKNAAVAECDAAVEAKATAEAETQKYKQLYSQVQNPTSDLISELAHQKSEAKRWEGNYNNLYSRHVKLKRSKGLAIE